MRFCGSSAVLTRVIQEIYKSKASFLISSVDQLHERGGGGFERGHYATESLFNISPNSILGLEKEVNKQILLITVFHIYFFLCLEEIENVCFIRDMRGIDFLL